MAKQKRRGKGGKAIEIPELSNAQSPAAPAKRQEKPGRKKAHAAKSLRGWRLELAVLLPTLLIGFLLYANALGGEFVYDDKPQIARNILIQDSSNLWRAMFSDVWAFKRGDAAAVSNYWRPTFVLWLITNFHLFGTDTFGWHLLNVLLHLAVVALAFFLLRRLKVSLPVAGAIALLFAAHPVHTESVAWISGSPDLILSVALLASLWFAGLPRKEQTKLRWTLAIAFYLIALGAKEIAIFYPIIVFVMLWRPAREQVEEGLDWARALKIALPFAVIAVLYLIVRQSILGNLAQWPEGGADTKSTILSAPMVFSFYLRQIIFPYWLGPSYPLRAVTTSNIGPGNFFIPLLVSLLVGGWMLWRARRSKLARMGLALFALPLIPAMNIAAFVPEQIVHDRYLYLPLLGFLMMCVPPVAALFDKAEAIKAPRREWLIYAAAFVLCVPLGLQTIRYNRAWLSDLALWQRAFESDPTSAQNYVQYGAELYTLKRFAEAVQSFDRAMEIKRLPLAYLGRGRSLLELKRFDEGEKDLRVITAKPTAQVPSHVMYLAYEALAIAYERQGRMDEAARILEEARTRLPQYRAALTEKLAVVLYQTGKKPEAYAQLESVRAEARAETLPESRQVFYRLGLLAAELGRNVEARQALQEYLAHTKNATEPEFRESRAEAEAALRRLPK
jgi:tetratricopeptide (TPR) repeat protein